MTEKQEIWREIDGFPNYEVSNLGRVRNVKTGRILNGTKNNYIQICLRKEGTRNYFDAHRIVAKAFIENPENKPCVNHINGNKHDNRVENLEWVSYSENSQHAYRTGLSKVTDNNIFKTNNPNPYPPQPCKCVETGQIFESQLSAAKYLGLCSSAGVNQSIKRGGKCKGYHFESIQS